MELIFTRLKINAQKLVLLKLITSESNEQIDKVHEARVKPMTDMASDLNPISYCKSLTSGYEKYQNMQHNQHKNNLVKHLTIFKK